MGSDLCKFHATMDIYYAPQYLAMYSCDHNDSMQLPNYLYKEFMVATSYHCDHLKISKINATQKIYIATIYCSYI